MESETEPRHKAKMTGGSPEGQTSRPTEDRQQSPHCVSLLWVWGSASKVLPDYDLLTSWTVCRGWQWPEKGKRETTYEGMLKEFFKNSLPLVVP